MRNVILQISSSKIYFYEHGRFWWVMDLVKKLYKTLCVKKKKPAPFHILLKV